MVAMPADYTCRNEPAYDEANRCPGNRHFTRFKRQCVLLVFLTFPVALRLTFGRIVAAVQGRVREDACPVHVSGWQA